MPRRPTQCLRRFFASASLGLRAQGRTCSAERYSGGFISRAKHPYHSARLLLSTIQFDLEIFPLPRFGLSKVTVGKLMLYGKEIIIMETYFAEAAKQLPAMPRHGLQATLSSIDFALVIFDSGTPSPLMVVRPYIMLQPARSPERLLCLPGYQSASPLG